MTFDGNEHPNSLNPADTTPPAPLAGHTVVYVTETERETIESRYLRAYYVPNDELQGVLDKTTCPEFKRVPDWEVFIEKDSDYEGPRVLEEDTEVHGTDLTDAMSEVEPREGW